MTKVDFRMRLARQGLFSCLPLPTTMERTEGSSDGVLEDKEQLKGCIKLWRTVIDRTLLFALSTDKEEAEIALLWLTGTNKKIARNFEKVCGLAFLEPEWVTEKALKLYHKFKNKKHFLYNG